MHKSVRSGQPGMEKVIGKILKKSGFTAERIAEIVFKKSFKKKFMIVTHSSGRTIFLMKRYLPISLYLKIIKSRNKEVGCNIVRSK